MRPGKTFLYESSSFRVLILLVIEQMVVIFRYSNVIVNRHKFVAHFAFMASTPYHHILQFTNYVINKLMRVEEMLPQSRGKTCLKKD